MIVRRIVTIAAVAVMIAIAGLAVATAPDSERITEPFYTSGSPGETVQTRLLDVRVDDVSAASRIEVVGGGSFGEPDPVYGSEGVWVVVDVTATSATDSLVLAGSILTVDGLSYSAFALPAPRIESFTVGSGVPVAGTLVFELPTAVFEDARDARLTLKGNFSMPLEQIAVIELPLAGTEIAPTVVIEPAAVTEVER